VPAARKGVYRATAGLMMRMQGEATMDEIEIVDYDPRWPGLFAAEAARLRRTLDPDLVGLEHFGSTAVPGLAAKPIIDILVAVRSLERARADTVRPLAGLGYVFWADNPKKDRLFFVKGMPPYGERRTHHLHITEPAGELWQQLAFQRHLRRHPEEMLRYAALKRRLAIEHRTDREAYTEAKAIYIAQILTEARKRVES
jgi:GrpB-like predicted nucleotidyltransferase (UPF0157 family)